MKECNTKIKMQKYIRMSLYLIIGWVFVLSGTTIPENVTDVQVTEKWAARYNGPGNGRDAPAALVVDGEGNVYVTGGSPGSGTSSDYATVKYDGAGNQLWVARYNGPPGDSSDSATAMSVDDDGNVYVTGRSRDPVTSYDYATVKYDIDGNQLWVVRYDGPGNDYDEATALAVDGEGNVYVTGGSPGSGTAYDYATVKYDGAGKELWAARYNGPGGSEDYAVALAVDEAGNVYVTGESEDSVTSSDYATVKYDPGGNEEWVARYDGPIESSDIAEALAVDANGNVYVTGWSFGSGTLWDYATVKYDGAGNELWVARYDGPIGSLDIAVALAVDANGNVYVTGQSYGGSVTGWDYATVKYDGAGNELWVARYNGPPGNGRDAPAALAVDDSGTVYVTGSSIGSVTSTDYATVKYDPGGNEEWVARYNGPGNNSDSASALAVDDSGTVYVTGSSVGSGTSFDYATVKYNLNTPPVADAGQDQTVCPQGTFVRVTLDGSSSRDPDGDTLNYTWTGPFGTVTGVNPTVNMPSGDVSTVLLTVGDGTDSDSDTVIITVEDTTPPAITAPDNVSVEQTSSSGTPVTLGTPTVSDICDTDPVVTNDAPALFPPGDTTVTWTATDVSGNSNTATQTVTVTDTTAPAVTAKLIPVKLKKKKGCFRVEFTATDIIDTDPTIVADLNGYPVTNGQLVKLKHKRKFKVKTPDNDGSSDDKKKRKKQKKHHSDDKYEKHKHKEKHKGKSDDNSSDDGSSDDSSGDRHGCGDVKLEGHGFTLNVIATDDAGNVGAAVDIYFFDTSNKKDDDGDGYGNNQGDCDDTDPTISPDDQEVCDGKDNNCDGQIDEGFKTAFYYEDADGDGYGNANVTTESCKQPSGYLLDNTDCNDNDATVNPDAQEVCDGVDNNCDGQIDEPEIIFTFPVDGSTINSFNTMVTGTISTCSQEVGIIVNGVLAEIAGGEFAANDIFLEIGANTLTAVATDKDGNTATDTITVYTGFYQDHVTLSANITSGISPLDVKFSIDNQISNQITTYEMDFEGDGTQDQTITDLDNVSFTYEQEGLYYPTITVTDDQGYWYTDTIAINVLSLEKMDALFNAKWGGMKSTLINQDIEGTLELFDEDFREVYREQFTELSSVLNTIGNELGNLRLVTMDNNSAEYEIIVTREGVTYSFYLLFVRDQDGLWKIRAF